MRLRESVPLEEGKPAGVNAACHEGVLGEPDFKKISYPKIDHVASLVAA